MNLRRYNVSKERIYSFHAAYEEDLVPCLEEAKSLIDANMLETETETETETKLEREEETYKFKIKNQEYDSFLSHPKLAPLQSWIEKCIDFTMQDLGFEKEKLEITHSWGNRFDKLKCAERHTDNYSIMTGVLILSNGNNKSFFLRYDSSVWYKMFLSHSGSNNYYIKDLEPGELFLFPSRVPHGTTPGSELCDPLYTVSFNTFLKDFKKRSLNYKQTKGLV